MSLLGMGGSPPTLTTVPIDAGTNGLINSTAARGQQSTADFANAQNNGVSQGADTAKQSDQALSQQNAQSGNQDDAINSAIRNQYNSQAGGQISRMKDAYSQQAQFQKSAALQQAAAAAMARQNVQTQTYAQLMQAYNQTEAARAQVLNSILGAAGTVGGMAAAGGSKKGIQTGVNVGAGTQQAAGGMGDIDTNNMLS